MEFPEFTGDPLTERPDFCELSPDNFPPIGVPGVYRFRDAEDGFLYVGESGDVCRRYKEHRRKPWFKDAVRFEVCGVIDPELRLLVETMEILRFRPRHNRALKLGLDKQGRIYSLAWR